jgi:hypothetical protein
MAEQKELKKYRLWSAEENQFFLYNVLGEAETVVQIYSLPTDKKPASMAQIITLAPRAQMTVTSLMVSPDGKVTADKTLEYYWWSWTASNDGEKTTWKTSFPTKPSAMYSYSSSGEKGFGEAVRVKATAKMTPEGGYTGLAASVEKNVDIKWVLKDEDKPAIGSGKAADKFYKIESVTFS